MRSGFSQSRLHREGLSDTAVPIRYLPQYGTVGTYGTYGTHHLDAPGESPEGVRSLISVRKQPAETRSPAPPLRGISAAVPLLKTRD